MMVALGSSGTSVLHLFWWFTTDYFNPSDDRGSGVTRHLAFAPVFVVYDRLLQHFR